MENMDWIKRIEKEPSRLKFNSAILIGIKSNDGIKPDQIDIAYWDESKQDWFDYYFKKPVVFDYWMPLPKLP